MDSNLQEIAEDLESIDQKLPGLLRDVEDLKAEQLPKAPSHVEADRAKIRQDFGWALRQYTESARSTTPSICKPSTPSLQVSSLPASRSSKRSSEYRTAYTHLAGPKIEPPFRSPRSGERFSGLAR